MENPPENKVDDPLSSYSQPLSFEKVWLMFEETNKQFQETDRKFQETDRKFQETDRKIKALAGLFTTQWGKLVESLVEPACLKLFKERGIKIEQSMRNVKVQHGDEGMECDVLLVNSEELVVVEVKTTGRVEDIREFIEKLKAFKRFFKQYKTYRVYGAVAALKYDGEADKLAYRQGLFVLSSSGEGLIKIANDHKFKPLCF
jgi:hypothetical protein